MGLKIACITPWGKTTKCGIRTYSEALTRALAEKDVDCYVVRLIRFGNRSMELMRNLAESVPKEKVSAILVEHEYGLYRGHEGTFYQQLKELGLPIVSTMHAVGVMEGTDKVVSHYSDMVIVHNRFCQRVLRREGLRNNVVIPHGVAPTKALPVAEARARYGVPAGAKMVGYLGFLSEYKGLEDLILGVSKVPNVGLLVAGGWHAGPEPEYVQGLKRMAAQLLPGRCDWLGYIPDSDLAAAYSSMNLVIYPSRFVSESGGLLLALSHGKAVLARNLAPNREKKRLGALDTFRNLDDMAEKIRLILGSDSERQRLEEGARSYCESVSWSKVADEHIRLFSKLLSPLKQN